ncbi:MAG TPA: prolyl oligopeptidase family serine peptidase [Opitutaceae bacterium]
MKKFRPALAVLIIGSSALLPLRGQSENPVSEKRVPTHADIWLMRRLGQPVISPDGKWVVVPVEEPAYSAPAEHRDLWLLSVDGAFPARKITAGRNEQTGIEWSPVGLKLAFSSRREQDEKAQIYVLDLSAGGEAERFTNMPGGARAPHWSPDGTKLLFTSDVAPENRDGSQSAKPASVLTYERYPVRVGERWLDERRPRLFVQDANAGAAPTDLLANTPFANSAVWRGAPNGTSEDLPAVWTPDGTSVVFVGCVNADALAYSKLNTELFSVPIRGGEATRLTQGTAEYGQPCFSPDAHALLVRVTQQTQSFYHLPKLMRYAWPWTSAEGVAIEEGFDREPGQTIFAGSGERVLFTADDGGVDKLFEVPIGGGTPKVFFSTESGSVESVAANGSRGGRASKWVFVASSSAAPPEVYVLEEKDGKQVSRRISDFNTARAASIDFPAAESLVMKTSRGESVQSWLFRPAQFDAAKKYPVIVLVRDGPEDVARDAFATALNPHLLAGNKYVVLETNYRGSVGFGEAFTQSLAKDPVKGPADDVIEALNSVLQDEAFVDPSRVAAIGVGYGGLIVNWLQATTASFRCFVVQGGSANPLTLWATTDRSFDRETLFGGPTWEAASLWHDQNPVALAGNHAAGTGWVTPMLLATGEKDFHAPLNTTLENWTYLQRLKVPSRLLVFPEEGHRLHSGEDDRYFMREVQAWLAQWFEAGK